jgi:hypothetical protein
LFPLPLAEAELAKGILGEQRELAPPGEFRMDQELQPLTRSVCPNSFGYSTLTNH